MSTGNNPENRRSKIRIFINLIIAILVLTAWIIAASQKKAGLLSAEGLSNLRFFTVQSNVFRGVVSAVIAAMLMKGADQEKLKKLTLWNYAATCAISLTFLVVFAFFAPLYGPARVLTGANFFSHLVVPVLAIAEYIVFNETPVRMPKSLIAILPPLLYGIFYVINLMVNGIGYGPDSSDWYGFAIWGVPAGLGIFAVICVAALLLGLLLNRINEAAIKKHSART